MLPFMAQGACQAIEDAVVLAVASAPAPHRAQAADACRPMPAARQERTAKIQIGSRGNQWMKTQGNADWVYGYDAWTVPLGA
jgi:salicylate hydroxylase